MRYLPELNYFDKKDFPFEKAFAVTAGAVSDFCSHYYIEVLAPKKGIREKIRKGELPKGDRLKFIQGLLEWLWESSDLPSIFAFFLDKKIVDSRSHNDVVFDHHDDTCCWLLNLTDDEFKQVRDAWEKQGLPRDLFYPETQEGVRIPVRGNSLKQKIFRKATPFNRTGFFFRP